MKFFISSVITGFEAERAIAKEVIRSLGHEPLMAEDFRAQPLTPQVACLQAVRQADAVVLLLGSAYGTKQKSGLSPTHEEYREARETRPIFVFVDGRASPTPDQANFQREVQDWGQGQFTGTFESPGDLRGKLIQAIHQWALANASGVLDPSDMLERALALVPDERGHSYRAPTLVLAIATGPHQPILRPSELEGADLGTAMMREAEFGNQPIFDHADGKEADIVNDALVITQGDSRSITLEADGSIVMRLPIPKARGDVVIIEENVKRILTAAVAFAAWLLDHIDGTQRLTHFAIVGRLVGGMMCWRTQAEQNASPNSYSMNMREASESVYLKPPHRSRAMLRHKADDLVTDLLTLLRRQAKSA